MVKRLALKWRELKRERGIALLATMLAIAMMMIIIVDFTSSTAMGYLSAANHANEIRAEYLARSAINVGLALIAQDTRAQLMQQMGGTSGQNGAIGQQGTVGQNSSTPGQNSATGQTGGSSVSGQQQPDSFMSVWALPFPPMPVNGGTVQLSVVDEARKFNINSLINFNPTMGIVPQVTGTGNQPLGAATPIGAEPNGAATPTPAASSSPSAATGQPGQINPVAVMQLTRLVMLLGISPEIIPPIVDWLDPDSIESQGGAEADYYLKLIPPYEPRNGPMPTLGDLRMIKGIDDATFMKLRNYLTVAPEPAVNVNTAPAEVLACLDDSLANNPNVVKQILEARAIRPFSNVTDVLNLIGGAASQSSGGQSSLTRDLTTRTTYFSITGMGTYAGARRLVFATFKRNGDGTGTLSSWQEE
jgi:type II secretory pathway component PulK